MNKLFLGFFLGLLAIALISGMIYLNSSLTAQVVSVEDSGDFYSYTKAICSESHCADVYVECNGNDVIDVKIITRVKDFRGNWEDIRDLTQDLCNNKS